MNDEDNTIVITKNGPLLPLNEDFTLVGVYPDVWLIKGELVGQEIGYDDKGRLVFKNGQRVVVSDE